MPEFQGLSERTYRLRVFDVKQNMRYFNYTPALLAKKIDVSTRTLNNWLKGEQVFVKNIIALAEVFGTNPQSLIEGMEPCATQQMEQSRRQSDLSVSINIDCATPDEFMYLCELLGEVKEKLQAFKTKKSEPKCRVYYFEAIENETLRATFFYVLVSSLLHEKMLIALANGEVPDYAVVIDSGYGKPCEELKDHIRRYYGFDHAIHSTPPTSNNKAIDPPKPLE